MRARISFLLTALLVLITPLRADDAAASAARQSMHDFVVRQMINGTYYYYDPVEAQLLALRFTKIHDEVRRDGNFLMSCSHFNDQFGRSIDLDFLVLPKGSSYVTTQAIIHEIDGKKRPYQLQVRSKSK